MFMFTLTEKKLLLFSLVCYYSFSASWFRLINFKSFLGSLASLCASAVENFC